jgi:hypothetical protein
MLARRTPLLVFLVCLALLPGPAADAGAGAPLVGRPAVQARGAVDLPRTGQADSYAPGDDGALQTGMEWPDPRFVHNGDGTITDSLTGLMWTQTANPSGGGLTWANAMAWIAAMNRGEQENLGHTDWRMPNIIEIESLVHAGQANPAAWLNSQGFSHVPEDNEWSHFFWSSSGSGSYAKIIWFTSGAIIATLMSYTGLVWPVRTGGDGAVRLPKTA